MIFSIFKPIRGYMSRLANRIDRYRYPVISISAHLIVGGDSTEFHHSHLSLCRYEEKITLFL